MDRELPVSVWPEWKITEKIGEGSFGKVYKAERSENDKKFYSAIKLITIPSSQSEWSSVRSESPDDQSAREYFQSLVKECIQEVSTMEYFRGNSHIVSVEDYKVVEYLDTVGWEIYIRMEYLSSFLEYCAGKALTEDEVLCLGIDLCKALEYCQKQNVIHRDIKPENIFVSRFGEFKLGDFGIARELERSMSGLSKKGTFSYMAPEMYRGETYDNLVDIYSLGIVLYKLQNHNRLPFLDLQKQLITYRDKENALARRMAGEDLPAPGDAKADFARVICKACAYDRKDRYQSPGEFREALEEIRYRRKHPGAVQRQSDIQAVRPEAVSPEPVRSEPVRSEPVRPEPVSRPVNREYRQKTPQPVQRPAERTPSRNSARRRKKKKGTTRLLIAVTLMAFAVLIVGVLFVRLLIRKSDSSGVNGNYVQMESAKGDELTQELNQIQEQATTIVNNLSNYNWIGSEAEGRISYLDENGTVMKILIYPSLSAEGYYEEYYYWDGELFFAYIWADENTLPYLEEGEQKVNLYYYKDDELIRWIDDNNRCHDLETDNEEYVNRGEKYLSQAKEYASRLSVEEGAG